MGPGVGHMRALIVGGTNGLGREIAKIFKAGGYDVLVAGRVKRDEDFRYLPLSISSEDYTLGSQLDMLARESFPCDILVYASGYYQEGLITDLSDDRIKDMMLVGVTAPAMLLSRMLDVKDVERSESHKGLNTFIAITSTSQWTPRKLEPVYTAAKAGLGMLSRSLAEDGRIKKVLVAGPAGMKTDFWKDTDKDTKDMLDPKWVAERIVHDYYAEDYRYKFIKIHRNPARVEIADIVNT